MPTPDSSVESRKKSTPARSTVTMRSHSSCTHCSPTLGHVPHDAPVVDPSFTAVTAFHGEVYEAVAVAIGAMLPSSGAVVERGTVTEATSEMLPAASRARR